VGWLLGARSAYAPKFLKRVMRNALRLDTQGAIGTRVLVHLRPPLPKGKELRASKDHLTKLRIKSCDPEEMQKKMLNKKLTRRNALKLGLLSGGLALFSGRTNAPTIGTRRAAAQTPIKGSPAVKNTAYVANEQSCTVSVIDTTTHIIKTTIGLGSDPAIPGTPQPNGPFNGETQHHNAFYNGHVIPTASGSRLMSPSSWWLAGYPGR
jgi:YVTN family beta-propeller protein